MFNLQISEFKDNKILRLIRILLSEAKITRKYKKEEKVFPSVV
jgi:hypothetical protein